jgi:fibronectin-binding autotransporter adhesin
MPRSRRSVSKLLFLATALSLTGAASATTYTDATGDNFGGPEVDISSVVVTNDAFDLHVTINLNTAANLSSAVYGSYEMGIQVNGGAGGQTLINNNYGAGTPTAGLSSGNPYGTTAGISTGENFFIGSELMGSPNSATGGATLYGFDGVNQVWNNLYSTYTDPVRFSEVQTVTPSISFYFPLTSFVNASLPSGLTAGTTFKFDVWTTFTTGNPPGQGAYDALDNPTNAGLSPTPWMGTTYDAATATGSTFNATTYTVVSSSVNGVWNVDGGGSWNAAGSWTAAGVPNGPASTATFGSILDSSGSPPAIVTVDTSQTVGQITFNNSNSYSITSPSGTTSLTINDAGDSGGVNPSINVQAGSHSISAPLFLAAGVTLNTAASTSLSVTGGIAGTGPLTVSGGGSVTLGGADTYSGNTLVSAGTLKLGAVGSLPSGTNLTIGTGANVVAANLGTASRIHLNVASVGITGTGKLDLTDNDMTVIAGGEAGFATVYGDVKSGRGTSGTWTGSGITSSLAAAAPGKFAVGVVVNDKTQDPTGAAALSGTAIVTTFDGQPVNDGDVLVKYTYAGDANLDGVVNAADYLQIDNGFNSGGTAKGWYNGDFNYDGVVNGDDYALIDNAFNTQGGVSLAGVSAGPAAMIAGNTEQVAVPEPGMLSLLAIGAGGLIGRRRRKM